MRLFVFLLFLVGVSCSPDRPVKPFLPSDYRFPTDDSFTVMTWNLENLVDGIDSPYINNRLENRAEVNPTKLQLIAQVLKLADADIITFQEVESRPLILMMIDSLLPNMGYQFSASSESPDWHQNVVILSRFPLGPMSGFGATHSLVYSDVDSLGRVKSQSMINTRLVSVPVWVRPNYAFQFTGVHLKAGRGVRNQGMRRGQMELLFDFLSDSRLENQLLAGDFNTVPDSVDFEFMLNGDTQNRFTDLFGGPRPFSHPADSVFWRLDHILPNAEMLPEFVSGSAEIFTPFSPDSMNAASDHLPVLAKFLVRDMGK